MAKKDTTIMQHVLEVRFERHLLPFIDFKGELTQYLLESYKAEKLKISDNRVDILSPDEKTIYFIGTGSFGFQMDNVTGFDGFNTEADTFLDIISGFTKYPIGRVARIGTKSTVFKHTKGVGFDSLRETISDKYLKGIDGLIGDKTDSKVVDIAVPINYTTPKGNLNISIAPIKKQQLLKQVLLRESSYQSVPENGLVVSMDYFQNEIGPTNFDALNKKIKENINEMKTISQKILKEL